MDLVLKHIDVEKTIIFLEKLELKGIKSINRSRLVKKLTSELEHIADGEKVIRDDFEDDIENRNKELRKYFNESVRISGEEMFKPLEVIRRYVNKVTEEDSEEEFSGEDAYVLSILYDSLDVDSLKEVSDDE